MGDVFDMSRVNKGAVMNVERLNRPSEVLESDLLQRVEQTANYEGNWGLLLFERVEDPVVFEQMVELYYAYECAVRDGLRNGEYEDHPDKEDCVVDRFGNTWDKPAIGVFQFKTREAIREEVRARINRVEHSATEIDYADERPTARCIHLDYKDSGASEPLTARQWSMYEAHEKGHLIRHYRGEWFNEYFRRGFDPDAALRQDRKVPGTAEYDMGMAYYNGYLLTAHEIAERMAQLKNYFGMQGHDEFTAQHLAYAREHYLEDVGVDNNVGDFFAAITPDTEAAFLGLINTAGI